MQVLILAGGLPHPWSHSAGASDTCPSHTPQTFLDTQPSTQTPSVELFSILTTPPPALPVLYLKFSDEFDFVPSSYLAIGSRGTNLVSRHPATDEQIPLRFGGHLA